MARPTRVTLTSGISSWDADIDFNFGIIADAPFPMYQVETTGELPTADAYEDCFALVGEVLYKSDGVLWNTYLSEASFIEDSTATTVIELVDNFNQLLSSLKTAGIMASL